MQGSRDIVLGVLASLAMPGPTGESLVLGHASVAAGAKAVNGTAIGTGSVIEDAATVEGHPRLRRRDDRRRGPAPVAETRLAPTSVRFSSDA